MQHDDCPTSRNSSETTGTCTADDSIASDVLAGLSDSPKSLQCKYLYDERGSQLFDDICELEEYYLTRTEAQIMNDHASGMAEALGDEVVLVEYGSGSSTKTRVLLSHLLSPGAYVPVDISEEHLLTTAKKLDEEFSSLLIHPVVADFTKQFDLPDGLGSDNVCIYFPGSTIGNLEACDAQQLLADVAERAGEHGKLLIGFDLQKDREVLELAYDDPQGVTASFSLNILHRLNRELDANFDIEGFQHVSFYNDEAGRIEIYIESLVDQSVEMCDQVIEFAAGERIHTEYSHKYTIDGFAEMAQSAGLTCEQVWTDSRDYFAVMLLSVSQA